MRAILPILVLCVAATQAAVASPPGAAESAVPPPQGATLLMDWAAEGVQVYTCAQVTASPSTALPAWVFKAPEANLFDAAHHRAATHFAGPTWKAADGSTVVGTVADHADAPGNAAIPWLLLRAKSHGGAGTLASVAFIRRIDTAGGLPPANGCDAGHAGTEARVPYTARYLFYRAP